jgi:hypothetical protein
VIELLPQKFGMSSSICWVSLLFVDVGEQIVEFFELFHLLKKGKQASS